MLIGRTDQALSLIAVVQLDPKDLIRDLLNHQTLAAQQIDPMFAKMTRLASVRQKEEN